MKVDVVFEFFMKFGMLFYMFYDIDVVLEGDSLCEYVVNFVWMVDYFGEC